MEVSSALLAPSNFTTPKFLLNKFSNHSTDRLFRTNIARKNIPNLPLTYNSSIFGNNLKNFFNLCIFQIGNKNKLSKNRIFSFRTDLSIPKKKISYGSEIQKFEKKKFRNEKSLIQNKIFNSSFSFSSSFSLNAGNASSGMKTTGEGQTPSSWTHWLLIFLAVFYVTIMIIIPTLNIFAQAFSNGFGPFIENLFDPDFQHAVKMTLILAAIVVPINTIFGLIIGLWVTRREFWGKAALISFIDLPFSISPIVTGLMLMLLYGRQGFFAPLLKKFGIEVVFALPGMILATAFVTLPFVAREVIPVLNEMDTSEEEAARTMGANEWEVFWDVTLPNIRLGLLYGITLCNARAMGEFGAISVISGNIIGKTQTLTLFVESAYKEYNTQGAYSAALLLSVLALFTLVIKTSLENLRAKEKKK